ncbi:MAG: winged helix-turn-helix transcriptional regulator [Anaerolineales bacterium]|uniref:winged helix-turn-helix transcriptional regulator n=1 Tax=Hydrogenophaga sp. TaxID=1904254 RepID=UPI0026041A13|nr:winged helix-turn-helix transcriptional regulator [Hydrogenophaga sp.]MDP2975407.1 winged helix-turn-helix transcriptional regulator [Anaerolineales bacterium]
MPRKSPPNLGSMAYLRLLNLVGAIQRGQPALDPIEERLLNRMATAWHRGERVSVTEAMETQEGLAPATVHRRLKRLRDKGLIILATDEHDQRVRYIEPTPQSVRYFAELDACLQQVRSD